MDQDQFKSKMTTVFVVAAVVLCVFTLGAVLVVITLYQGPNTVVYIASIVGVSTPITAGLIALINQQMHLQMNSRMSQLLEITGKASGAAATIKEKERVEIVAQDHPVPPIPNELLELGRKLDLLETLIKKKGEDL